MPPDTGRRILKVSRRATARDRRTALTSDSRPAADARTAVGSAPWRSTRNFRWTAARRRRRRRRHPHRRAHQGLRRPGRRGRAAVESSTCAVHKGEIFGLLGPNGAGKTTTVGMLTTRVIPTSGEAWVGGIDVVAQPADRQAGDRRRAADQHPRPLARRRREPVLPRSLLRHERPGSTPQDRRAARAVPPRRPGHARTSTSCRAAWRSG